LQGTFLVAFLTYFIFMGKTQLRDAIVQLIQEKVGVSIDLTEIGPTLVADGFDQHVIANALEALSREGVIKFVGNNRVELAPRP
jgi:hypothetical protein